MVNASYPGGPHLYSFLYLCFHAQAVYPGPPGSGLVPGASPGADSLWPLKIYPAFIRYSDCLFSILAGNVGGERFRLSLHLPVSPALVALAHLLVGMTVYCALALADLWGIGLIAGLFFPWQGIKISLLTTLPWTMAGAGAYLGMALALLEPDFRLKAVNLIIGAGVTGLYLQNVDPGAYGPSLGLLIVPVVLMMPAVLLPVFRFRYRRVG